MAAPQIRTRFLLHVAQVRNMGAFAYEVYKFLPMNSTDRLCEINTWCQESQNFADLIFELLSMIFQERIVDITDQRRCSSTPPYR